MDCFHLGVEDTSLKDKLRQIKGHFKKVSFHLLFCSSMPTVTSLAMLNRMPKLFLFWQSVPYQQMNFPLGEMFSIDNFFTEVVYHDKYFDEPFYIYELSKWSVLCRCFFDDKSFWHNILF